jgi:hypothetical protein
LQTGLSVCADYTTFILSLPQYLTAGCCQGPEHAPNRILNNFRSIFISGLREQKRISNSWLRGPTWPSKVLNPLWLLAGPKKLPEADILNITDECCGDEPVHPSAATYKKMATSIISMEWLTPELLWPGHLGLGSWRTSRSGRSLRPH